MAYRIRKINFNSFKYYVPLSNHVWKRLTTTGFLRILIIVACNYMSFISKGIIIFN